MTHLEAILIHQCILCYINYFPLYYLIFLATTCDRTSGRDSSKMHQSIRRIRSLSYLFVSFLRNFSSSKSRIQFFKNAIVSDIILNGVKVSSTVFPPMSQHPTKQCTPLRFTFIFHFFKNHSQSTFIYLSQLNNLFRTNDQSHADKSVPSILTIFWCCFFPVKVIILYFYFLVSIRLANTIQRQAAFFRLIHVMFLKQSLD